MDPLSATILVLVITSSDIVLAADSRKTSLAQNGVRETGVMDKIYQANDYYYAVSGLDSTEDGSFSIQSIIHKMLQQFSDFDLAARTITVELSKALKEFFTKLKESSSAIFTHFQNNSASGGEIIILKRVGAVPTAYLLDYKIIDGSNIKVVMNSWKTDCSKITGQDECFWRAIGHTSFLKGNDIPEEKMTADPVLHAKLIIEEGIKRYPVFVGAPINILSLNEAGVQWIEKNATSPNRIRS
jgi:hypothetical protein